MPRQLRAGALNCSSAMSICVLVACQRHPRAVSDGRAHAIRNASTWSGLLARDLTSMPGPPDPVWRRQRSSAPSRRCRRADRDLAPCGQARRSVRHLALPAPAGREFPQHLRRPRLSGAVTRAYRLAVELGRVQNGHPQCIANLGCEADFIHACVAARAENGARYGVGRDLLIPARPVSKFPLN
jgi:hypothetical protein